MIQSGVDEAGKGPVLGPMVIGLVSGDPLEFKNMGVKDSKALSLQSRLKLFQMIKDSSEYVDWIIIKSTELNEKMKESTLNVIEEQKVSELILKSPCTEVGKGCVLYLLLQVLNYFMARAITYMT